VIVVGNGRRARAVAWKAKGVAIEDERHGCVSQVAVSGSIYRGVPPAGRAGGARRQVPRNPVLGVFNFERKEKRTQHTFRLKKE
jgi:hypothetical protein